MRVLLEGFPSKRVSAAVRTLCLIAAMLAAVRTSHAQPILSRELQLIIPFMPRSDYVSMNRFAVNPPDSLRWELHLATPFLLNRGGWSNIAFAVTPEVVFRKRRDDVVQIRIPSYMPRLEAWAWWPSIIPGLKSDVANRRLFYYSARIWNHHSNGQEGDFHSPDSVTRNEQNGSFSTNYWELGGNWTAPAFKDSSSYAAYAGYRRYINYAGFRPAYDQPLDSSYGSHRLVARGQLSVRHTSFGLPLEEIWGSAQLIGILDRKSALEPQYRSLAGRMVASVSLSVEPKCTWWPDDFGLFANYAYGQDYQNIAYGHSRSMLRLGISGRALPSPRSSVHSDGSSGSRIPGCGGSDARTGEVANKGMTDADIRGDLCTVPKIAWCLIDPFLPRSFVTFLGGAGNMGKLIFEARGVPHFVSRDELEERHWRGINVGKLAIDISPHVILRMQREGSAAVYAPSFLPRVTAYWFPSDDASISARKLTYYTLSGFQHTNLESGPVFLPSGHVDTVHGRFNTWGAEAGVRRTFPIGAAMQNTISATGTHLLRYHLTPELRNGYGRNRVTVDNQLLLSAFRSVVWFQAFATVMDGDARFVNVPNPSGIDRHLITSATLSIQPPFWTEAALFVSGYRGQDYYNARYSRLLNSLTVGLSLQERTLASTPIKTAR